MLPSICVGALKESPTTFSSYEGIPPGSRSLIMGYAYSAVGGDPATVYFNPAGLISIQANCVSATFDIARQSELSPETVFAAESLKKGNLIFLSFTGERGSFSWRPLADETLRTENGTNWTESEIKVNAFTFSASNENDSTTYSGLNLSYLNGRIGQAGIENGVPFTNLTDGNGFSLDLGFLFKPSEELKLGLNLRNLLGFMWWDDFEKDQLPFSLRAGLAFDIARFLTFASDWEKTYYRKGDADAVQTTHFGIEQRIGNILSVRAGIYGTDLNSKDATHLTAGLGYDQNNYRFSLSGEKYSIQKSDVYRFAFSMDVPL
jgi:hypothetical protein